MRKKALLALVPTAGLLSLLWLSSSQSTALAFSSTTGYTLKLYWYGDGEGEVLLNFDDYESFVGNGCDTDSLGYYCYITFSAPQNLTLEAEPEPGYGFAGWGGDCSSCGTSTTCTIYLNANKTCSVTFTASGGSGSGGGSGSSGGSGGSGSGSSGGSSGSGSGGSGTGSGGGSGSGVGGGTGGGGGGGGCSMTGSASSMAGLWNILVWLSVPAFALVRRIRRR